MRCPEARQTLHQFLDGQVDDDTRKQLGLHLVACEECSRLINDEKFWDDAVVALLDHEAPADLRAQILNDAGVDATTTGLSDRQVHLKRMNWRTKLNFFRWAATRNSSPRMWLESAALVAGIVLFLQLKPHLFPGANDESFQDQGQVAIVTDGQVLTPDSPLVSSSLSLPGRLF